MSQTVHHLLIAKQVQSLLLQLLADGCFRHGGGSAEQIGDGGLHRCHLIRQAQAAVVDVSCCSAELQLGCGVGLSNDALVKLLKVEFIDLACQGVDGVLMTVVSIRSAGTCCSGLSFTFRCCSGLLLAPG